MLQWMGGSRRAINEAKNSLKSRQIHFFNQQRLQNKSPLIQQKKRRLQQIPESTLTNKSLDLISLNNFIPHEIHERDNGSVECKDECIKDERFTRIRDNSEGLGGDDAEKEPIHDNAEEEKSKQSLISEKTKWDEKSTIVRTNVYHNSMGHSSSMPSKEADVPSTSQKALFGLQGKRSSVKEHNTKIRSPSNATIRPFLEVSDNDECDVPAAREMYAAFTMEGFGDVEKFTPEKIQSKHCTPKKARQNLFDTQLPIDCDHDSFTFCGFECYDRADEKFSNAFTTLKNFQLPETMENFYEIVSSRSYDDTLAFDNYDNKLNSMVFQHSKESDYEELLNAMDEKILFEDKMGVNSEGVDDYLSWGSWDGEEQLNSCFEKGNMDNDLVSHEFEENAFERFMNDCNREKSQADLCYAVKDLISPSPLKPKSEMNFGSATCDLDFHDAFLWNGDPAKNDSEDFFPFLSDYSESNLTSNPSSYHVRKESATFLIQTAMKCKKNIDHVILRDCCSQTSLTRDIEKFGIDDFLAKWDCPASLAPGWNSGKWPDNHQATKDYFFHTPHSNFISDDKCLKNNPTQKTSSSSSATDSSDCNITPNNRSKTVELDELEYLEKGRINVHENSNDGPYRNDFGIFRTPKRFMRESNIHTYPRDVIQSAKIRAYESKSLSPSSSINRICKFSNGNKPSQISEKSSKTNIDDSGVFTAERKNRILPDGGKNNLPATMMKGRNVDTKNWKMFGAVEAIKSSNLIEISGEEHGKNEGNMHERSDTTYSGLNFRKKNIDNNLYNSNLISTVCHDTSDQSVENHSGSSKTCDVSNFLPKETAIPMAQNSVPTNLEDMEPFLPPHATVSFTGAKERKTESKHVELNFSNFKLSEFETSPVQGKNKNLSAARYSHFGSLNSILENPFASERSLKSSCKNEGEDVGWDVDHTSNSPSMLHSIFEKNILDLRSNKDIDADKCGLDMANSILEAQKHFDNLSHFDEQSFKAEIMKHEKLWSITPMEYQNSQAIENNSNVMAISIRNSLLKHVECGMVSHENETPEKSQMKTMQNEKQNQEDGKGGVEEERQKKVIEMQKQYFHEIYTGVPKRFLLENSFPKKESMMMMNDNQKEESLEMLLENDSGKNIEICPLLNAETENGEVNMQDFISSEMMRTAEKYGPCMSNMEGDFSILQEFDSLASLQVEKFEMAWLAIDNAFLMKGMNELLCGDLSKLCQQYPHQSSMRTIDPICCMNSLMSEHDAIVEEQKEDVESAISCDVVVANKKDWMQCYQMNSRCKSQGDGDDDDDDAKNMDWIDGKAVNSQELKFPRYKESGSRYFTSLGEVQSKGNDGSKNPVSFVPLHGNQGSFFTIFALQGETLDTTIHNCRGNEDESMRAQHLLNKRKELNHCLIPKQHAKIQKLEEFKARAIGKESGIRGASDDGAETAESPREDSSPLEVASVGTAVGNTIVNESGISGNVDGGGTVDENEGAVIFGVCGDETVKKDRASSLDETVDRRGVVNASKGPPRTGSSAARLLGKPHHPTPDHDPMKRLERQVEELKCYCSMLESYVIQLLCTVKALKNEE